MIKRLLIADDDILFLDLLTLEFEKRNSPFEIITADSGQSTIKQLTERKPDLLILDLRMPNIDGFKVLEHVQQEQLTIPVIIVTHFHDDEHKRRSAEFGVKGYYVKSDWHIGKLAEEIQRFLETE